MDSAAYSGAMKNKKSFNSPGSPNEMFAKAMNRNVDLQRYKVPYICGNYSLILTDWAASSGICRSAQPSQYFIS